MGAGESPHKARITVNFVEIEERGRIVSSDVMEEIREGLRGYPGVTITVDKDSNGPPVGKPISVEVSGDNFEDLIAMVSLYRP